MGRKVLIDLTDAIGTFMAKTNTLAEYIVDLDELNTEFESNYADSSIVSAINYLSDKVDSIGNVLFGGGGVLNVKGFIGDSAEFNRLRVGMLTADSATIDSATIGDLYVTGTMFADSARFDTIHVDSIGVQPGSTLVIDSASVNNMTVTSLIVDSANIVRLDAKFADIDSADVDSATINNLTVTSLTLDGQQLDNVKQFTIKDEGGVIVLGGFFLSTSDSEVP